jgi:co-chaperonin GroES (HSP10)
MQTSLLDMHKGEVVKVGKGSAQAMEIEVGDIAHIVKGPQYAVVMLDNQEYWVLAQHNILYVKRKNG